jgi:hypothetical protein
VSKEISMEQRIGATPGNRTLRLAFGFGAGVLLIAMLLAGQRAFVFLKRRVIEVGPYVIVGPRFQGRKALPSGVVISSGMERSKRLVFVQRRTDGIGLADDGDPAVRGVELRPPYVSAPLGIRFWRGFAVVRR